MDEEKLLIEKLQILEKRDACAIARRQKYANMTYAQVLQCDENKTRLRKVETEQRKTFELIIKQRHPELKNDWKDLFATYFMDFLAGKVISINDFLYEDRLASPLKRKLKKL